MQVFIFPLLFWAKLEAFLPPKEPSSRLNAAFPPTEEPLKLKEGSYIVRKVLGE